MSQKVAGAGGSRGEAAPLMRFGLDFDIMALNQKCFRERRGLKAPRQAAFCARPRVLIRASCMIRHEGDPCVATIQSQPVQSIPSALHAVYVPGSAEAHT